MSLPEMPASNSRFETAPPVLGGLPHLRQDLLKGISGQPQLPLVLAGLVCSEALTLLQQQTDTDLGREIADGIAARPTRYDSTPQGMTATVGRHTLTLQNPYTLVVYFPQENDGSGAAYYSTLPGITLPLAPDSRYITAQEATDYITDTALPVSPAQDGLFLARPEVEAVWAKEQQSNEMKRNLEEDAQRNIPFIRFAVDLRANTGSFTILESVRMRHGAYLNHMEYKGPASFTGELRGTPLYKKVADGLGLRQLAEIQPGETAFSDHPLFLIHDHTPSPARGIADILLAAQEANSRASGSPEQTPLILAGFLPLSDALADGAITEESLSFMPADPVRILHTALETGPDTSYFRELRSQIGPAFDQDGQDALLAQAKARALEQWMNIFADAAGAIPAIRVIRNLLT